MSVWSTWFKSTQPAAIAEKAEPCVVFISYPREDRAFVLRVAEALQIQGVVVHGDWELTGGESYEEQLRNLIIAADTLAFFLAPESVDSAACLKELQIAGEEGKRILPILHRDIADENRLPGAVREPQWLFLRPTDDFVEGTRELGRALNTDPELLPEHRRLSVAADNWDRGRRNRAYLLRGDGLVQAERWLARASAAAPRLPQPTSLQTAYIVASQSARRRSSRLTLVVAGVVILALGGLASVADWQRRVAEKRREVAEAGQLVAEANLMRARYVNLLPRSALLTLEAMRRSPSMQATQALLEDSKLLRSSVALFKHPDAVRSVAFNREGNLLAMAGDDGSVNVRTIASGQTVASLKPAAHAKYVAFGPDSGHLITAAQDQTARLWEIDSGREVALWPQKGTFAVSHDGSRIATVIAGEVRVFTPTGDVVQTASMEGYPVQIALSADGAYVATANADGLVQVASVVDGKEMARFTSEEGTYESNIKALVLSPDGKYVAAGSQDGLVRLWATQPAAQPARLVHGDAVLALDFSPDGELLASGSHDGSVRLWSAATHQEIARLVHEDIVLTVAFSPDGKSIATGSADKTVRIWSLAAEQQNRVFTYESDIADVAFSADGHDLVVASADGGTWAESLRTGGDSKPRQLTHQESTVWSLAFSPDGLYVATASDEDGTARLWRRENGSELAHVTHDGAALSVAFSPDSKLLASAGKDGSVRISRVPKGDELARFQHDALVQDVAFGNDGMLVASASEDGTARVWNVQTRQEVLRVTHDDGSILFGVAISPDGHYLATAGSDSTARVWRLPGGQSVARFGHEGMVYRVAFSPDGKSLATGSADKTARIWDLGTQREAARSTEDDTVTRIAFSPDGRLLATTTGRSTARVWQWRPEDLTSEVCGRLTRNLTEAEWQQYLGSEPYHRTCAKLP